MASESETPPGLEDFQCDCDDYESVISPAAYLADLVDYIAAPEGGYGHVHRGDDPLSIHALDGTFYQPFRHLVSDTEAAQEPARHVRITVESLLGLLADDDETGTSAEIPAASATAEYRIAAYEALLEALELSREDLRDAVYHEADREWVADAIGVPEARVTDLRLDPDAPLGTDYNPLGPEDASYPVSEGNLEALFGLPRLINSEEGDRVRAEPLRTIEEPFLRTWRREYLQQEWTSTDHPEDPYPRWLRDDSPYGASIDATLERPAIDPDLVGPDDFRPKPAAVSDDGSGSGTTLPDPGVPEPTDEFDPSSDYVGRTGAFPERPAALALWEVRRRWMDEQLAEIWRDTPAGPGSSSDVAGMLNGMLSAPQYRGRTGETTWYAGHSGRPATVTSSSSAGSPGVDPLTGRNKGFLTDFARLHAQLTGESEAAREARSARASSQFPTGDPDDDPAEAARTVVVEELHLTQKAFVRLVDLLRTHYADGESIEDAAWWEVAAILAGARKRSCFDTWIDEESDFEIEINGQHHQGLSVQLDRKRFWQPPREPGDDEWSFRLDRHDPPDPDADPEPYVDPEQISRSELPDEPHGTAARELYDQRRQTLAHRREEFKETFERERRMLQTDFETFASTYRSELQSLRSQMPDDGQVSDSLAAQSPLDDALDTHFGSVSWPDPSWEWERRFEWLSKGLRLARERDRSGSSLSASELQHAQDAEAKLRDLDLTEPAFERLATLREQAKPLPPEEQGLTNSKLETAFATLPTGNPLDPVLTTVYDSVSGASELQDVFDDQPPRWDRLFASIRHTLEERGTSGADGSGGSGGAGSSSGQQIPAGLKTMTLTTDEFETVLSLRRRSLPAVEPEESSDALVNEVIELLTSVWKRLEKYDASGGSGWIATEVQAGVTDYWDAYKAQLPAWRATRQERSTWQQALFDRSTAPTVDPDLLESVSDFEPPAHDRDGFELWERRGEELDGAHGTGLVYEIEQLRLAAGQNQQVSADLARRKLDASIRRTAGYDLETLRSIARRMERGDDVGILISRVDLSLAGLNYLVEVDDALGTKPIRMDEWASVAQILLRAWKHRQYGRWNREERARGVLLEPEQFSLPPEDADRSPPDDDDPLRWRVEWSVRTQWTDVLETRIDQWEGVDDEIDDAVAAAERKALPILREQLIERIDEPSASANDADTEEWLSERLLIDVEMTPDRDTTRTSQAITSLQNLVEAIDLSMANDGGLAGLDLSIEDEYFDHRWQWLGTYAKWKAAMGVYVYPQNVLLPTLRRRTTERFDEIARGVIQTADLTPAAASAAAQEYAEYMEEIQQLHPVAGCMAPGPTVRRRYSGDPEAVAYAFAKSGESGDYYFMAFDPESWDQPATPDPVDDPWADNSTWTRIPVEAFQNAEEVHGAASYDEIIYLFATVIEDSGGDGDGTSRRSGDTENGSGGSEKTLQYVTYDLRADTWGDPREIEFPETVYRTVEKATGEAVVERAVERLFGGTVEGAAEETVEVPIEYELEDAPKRVSMVQRAGLDKPPMLIVTKTGRLNNGNSAEGIDFDLLVEFTDDGEPPATEALAKDWIKTDPMNPLLVAEYHDASLAFFYRDVVSIESKARSGSTGYDFDGTANAVFARPTEGDAYLFDLDDEQVVRIHGISHPHPLELSTTGPDTEPVQVRIDIEGFDDPTRNRLVHCNNAVTRPSQPNEVVLGYGGPNPPYRPMGVDPLGPGQTQTVIRNRELAPALPESDWPWLFAVDPAKAIVSLEWTADGQRDSDVRSRTARTQQVYLEEAYYFLPLLIARQLTNAGEYESAIEWFRCIYDHTRGTPTKRAIWAPLAPSSGRPDAASSPPTDWLLDPIHPHGLAAVRSSGTSKWGQSYTQFTLFSIARCLSDYADAQFATDTAETVAMATDLYEQSLDVLSMGPLSPADDYCADLIERLEWMLENYVFAPEVWTDDPALTRAGAESRADRIRTVVRGIDRYVDRADAFVAITDALSSEGLSAALDVANEWAERESDEREYRERIFDWVELAGEFLASRPAIEPRLVEVATAVAGRGGGSDSGFDVDDSRSRGDDDGLSGRGVGLGTAGMSAPDWLDEDIATSISPANLDAAGVVDPAETDSVDWEIGTRLPTGVVTPSYHDEEGVNGSMSDEAGDNVFPAAVDRGTLDVLEANRHRFCIPDNPLLEALRRHAEVNLEKIRAGRNIAGIKRELDPYASEVSIESATPTPGGGVAGAAAGYQPTDYRYETLLTRAKDLAEQARQFESQYLQAIEKGVSERRKLKRARQKVDLAEERVSLQEVRMDRARAKVELARLKRERAVLKRDRYKQWIENPLVGKEQEAIDKLQKAVKLQRTAADVLIAATAAHGLAAGFHTGISYSYFSRGKMRKASKSMAAALSSTAAGLSTTANVLTTDASKLSTQAQIKQIQARKQRRRRRWKLKRDIATKNVEIGSQQVTIARETVDVVAQERRIAQLRADHAEDIVNFHETKFTNRELYDWIADVLKGVYRYFLQQAASVARMAQRQLAFERQSLPRKFINSDYWDAPTAGQTAVPAANGTNSGETNRRGLTGSARLLQDIYELDQHEFRTDERRLEVEKTISVAQQDPMALQRFRETGVLSFATTLEDFDADHPGHYHRMIEDVDLRIIALTDPVGGINATLSNSGTSGIVVGDTLFQEKTIDRDPESIVLNRARGEEGENEIRFRPQQREMLRPFEHSGVATDWELEMPRPANDMDYSTIADVQLTIEYSALESYDYRQRVLSELDPERTVERSYSFHDDFGDAWYELNNAPANADAMTVHFETERDDFPTNLFDLTLESAQLYFVVSGPDRVDKRENLKDLKVALAPVGGSQTKGRATNGVVDLGAVDTDGLEQEWELTVRPTDMGDPFADGTIEDILFIVTAEGEAPNWPS